MMTAIPLGVLDFIKIVIARGLNTIYHKLRIPFLRILGDILIRGSKIKCDGISYVLVDLSSLYIIDPKYELKVLKCVLSKISKGDVFIDVGAHIGKYTFVVAKRVAPTGKVIAIEPNPLVFKALVNGIRQNKLTNVIPLNIAVSDKNAIVKLYVKRSSTLSSIKEPDYSIKIISVISKSIDSIVQELNLNKVDWVKIDAEGAEVDILKGMTNTLTKFRPKIIIEVEKKNFDECTRIFHMFNYSYEILEEAESYYNIFCMPKN